MISGIAHRTMNLMSYVTAHSSRLTTARFSGSRKPAKGRGAGLGEGSCGQVRNPASCGNLSSHHRKLMLNRLELRNWSTKLIPFRRELNARLQHELKRTSDHSCANDGALFQQLSLSGGVGH